MTTLTPESGFRGHEEETRTRTPWTETVEEYASRIKALRLETLGIRPRVNLNLIAVRSESNRIVIQVEIYRGRDPRTPLIEGGNFKKHPLSLPESGGLRLLLAIAWAPECHQSGLGMKRGGGSPFTLA